LGLFRGRARRRRSEPHRQADQDQYNEIHRQRDDANVKVLDLRRQPRQRVEVRAGQANHGDRGDAGDDARRGTFARRDVAVREAENQRGKQLGHQAVAHQQEGYDGLSAPQGEEHRNQRDEWHQQLREP